MEVICRQKNKTELEMDRNSRFIHVAARMRRLLSELMILESKLAGNIRSSLVVVKYSRLPPKLLYVEGSSSFSQ